MDIGDRTKNQVEDEPLRCLKGDVLLPRRDEAHAIRFCLNITCINLPQFFGVCRMQVALLDP